MIWTPKHHEEAERLFENGWRGQRLAEELSRRWGEVVTQDAVSHARRRNAADQTGEHEPVFAAGPLQDVQREERTAAPVPAIPPPTAHVPIATVGGGRADRYLLISDLQIPFEHPDALPFCLQVQREFHIPTDNVICVGDETDGYFGSLYAHDPDASHTPNSEIAAAKERLKRWYRAFPRVRVCNSNHGDRWIKKASNAQIPSQLLRAYREIIEAPEGWQWADRWRVNTRHPFDVEHGHHGAQGIHAHRQKALDNGGVSIAHGHLHASAGIAHVRTAGAKVWGMNCGSLIDVDAFAFHYGRRDRFRPWLGVGVVLNDGATPLVVPYGSL